MQNREKIRKYTTIAIFAALVVVLQLIATFIKIGSFPITLTLVPIVIAGATLGIAAAGFLGLIFGVIVVLMVITGADPSGTQMIALHPVVTVTACLLKGLLAGVLSGLIYKLLSKKNQKIAIILAAAIAPITNTFILYLALILFFESSFSAFLTFLMTPNFIIELLINVLLAPALLRIINARKIKGLGDNYANK